MNLYKNTFKLLVLCVMVLNCSLISAQCNLLCNTDFEDNQVTPPAGIVLIDAGQVPCWQTTASDNTIEVWNSGFNGVPSYSGNQFIELNAFMVSTIFQNFTVAPGTALTISFAHRGRDGVDVMGLEVGPVGGPYTALGTYSDGNTAWGYYTVNYTVPLGLGNNYSIRFNSVSASGGNPAIGNFLDAISVNLPYTLTLITSHTNAGCNTNNGTASVSVSGGTAPYSYSWNSAPVQTTQAATGLASAGYTVTVTDSNGCVNTSAITLGMDPQPDVEVSAGLNPLCDSTKLNWASWASVNSTTGVGVISSDLSVTVTKPTGGLSTTGGMFNPGVFPTQYDVPVNNTAIRNDLAGLFTFCFNRPVVNPQIALSSIGNSGNSVQINTSVPYQVIWQGVGMSYPNNMAFIGSEGYTIIQFPGVHTCISFDYLQSETYCNLAFGTLDTNCQAVNPPPICAGQSDTLTATGASGYTWSPSAGLNATTGAVVVATPTVTTTYYVTGSNGTNCSDTDSITITVNPAPAASITGDTVICFGDSTTLTASGGTSYTWLPGNISGNTLTVTPSVTTTYTLVATTAGGCVDSAYKAVLVNSLPVVTVSPPAAICIGSSQSLTAGGAATYAWSLPTGLNDTVGSTVTATPLLNTTYTVTGTDAAGCKDTATVTVAVNSKPEVNVRAGDNPQCDSTKLNWASWTSVNATTGIGTISSNLSVTVTKPTGGLSTTGGMYNGGVFPTQYDVPANNTAIRNDLAGLFTFCFNVPVVNPQIALASIGNGGNSVQVNTSAPYQVIWQGQSMSYPNSTTFIGTEGFTIIQFPGVHTCISFDYLQSESYCNLAFGTLDTNCQGLIPEPICLGESDTLTASGASAYSWTPSTGLNTTTGAVVIATPAVTTTYYVTGVDTNSCSDTDSITIVVNTLPVVSLTGDTVICASDSTVLTVSGGSSYFWKPVNSADSSVTVSPANNTTYTAVVTNASGCVDSATIHVTVNPLPIAQFSVPPVCRTEQSVFTNASTGNITSVNWDFDDNTSGSSIQNPVHTYSTCDSFAVSLVVTTVDGCVDTATNTARVYCLPLADFSFANACMGQSVTFTDLSAVSGGTITAWSWDYGDTTTLGTTQSPSHAYANYGIHSISLISTTNQGCKDTSTQNITIHPLPIITFTANNVCAGSIVTFQNQSTIPAPYMLQSWVWDFADGTPVYNNPNILHPYPTPGVYTVELTVISDYGCADSLLDTVIVHPNPVVSFSATDTIGCAPLCLSFQDMSSIAAPAANSQWSWNLGDSSGTVTSLAFDHCYDNTSALAPAYYSVSLSVTSDSGCVTTLTKSNYITVLPNPLALFTADPEISIVYPVVTITDQSLGADFWNWDFGDTDTSSLPNPAAHAYADTGSYIITLITENQYGCLDTNYRNVIVEPTFTFFIPNGFTPNGDGVNDFFGGQGTFIRNYTMSIFDRWGNFIFRTDAIEKPWDGTANHGKDRAQQDTYVYVIEITDFKKQKHRYKGIVTLLAGVAD